MNDIDSPCIRNCCLDEDNVCLGCFRNVQEIMDWMDMDDMEKQSILELAQRRRKQHEEKYGS